jgi:rhodanese-related sulfurtransferase
MDHTPGFLKLVDDARPRVREISLDEARARQAAGARLIDVREDDEWNAAHAAGAQHIGKGVIERDIETKVPDKDAELILYCGGGFRSVLASEALGRMGYTNVRSMIGGWRGWVAAGAPIERPGEMPPGASDAG